MKLLLSLATFLSISSALASSSSFDARQSSTTNGDSSCSANMCVSATVNGSNVDYVLSATGKMDVGYMAVGFGSSMSGSPMCILWANPDGTITLSQRQASGHQMPRVVDNPAVTATLQNSLSTTSGSTPKYAFSIPSDGTTNVRMIYAFSDDKPSSAAKDATIQQHLSMGPFTLDLSKTTSGSGSSPSSGSGSSSQPLTSNQKAFVAHGIVAVLGFLFFLPLGSLTARYLRTFSGNWFLAHMTIQFCIAGPLIITAFALGVSSVSKAGGMHLMSTHQKLGVALFVLYLAQVTLGSIVHYAKPSSGRRPPQNFVHALFGILIISLSFYQVRTGYKYEWPKVNGGNPVPNGANILWYVWIVLIPVLYIAGLSFLPKQFRQEKHLLAGKN